jgi:hypothetical protein
MPSDTNKKKHFIQAGKGFDFYISEFNWTALITGVTFDL